MLKFFKTVLATMVGLALFTGLGIGSVTLLVLALSNTDPPAPKARKKTVLVYDLSTQVQDTPSGGSLFSSSYLEESGLSLRSVTRAIEAAAEDDKVVAIYLQGSSGGGDSGFASLAEIRKALQKFRDSGKPIFAYDSDWSETEYFLGSVANTVAVDPIGEFALDGFSSEVRFYAGALEKYGVGVQVIRVGQFKSAVEPYLNKTLSAENRKQTEALLGSLWSNFLVTVAENRDVTVAQLQGIANRGGLLSAKEALEQKLVDRVAYADEIAAELQKLTEVEADEDFRETSLGDYVSFREEKALEQDEPKSDRIAVLYMEGEIVSGSGFRDVISSETMVEELRQLRLDEDVKSVVLRVNSPGGSAIASSQIGREVTLLAKVKPVVVSMGDYAASGGYWIAAPAEQIFAEAGTITGSIGTFGLLPNVQKLANANGITWDSVKTAPFANSDTIARPKTAAELALRQRSANEIYSRFLDLVAEGRGLKREAVAQIAEGRVWSGSNAKAIGLVDELGGLDAAIASAASLAKLQPGDWSLEELPAPRSLEEELIDEFFSGAPATQNPLQRLAGPRQQSALPPVWTKPLEALQGDLAPLLQLSDPKGLYTRLPFNLEIR
jgi:protease IV